MKIKTILHPAFALGVAIIILAASVAHAQTNVPYLYSPEKLREYALGRIAVMEEFAPGNENPLKPNHVNVTKSTNDIMAALAKIAPARRDGIYLIFKDDDGNMLFDVMATNLLSAGLQKCLDERPTWCAVPVVFERRIEYADYTTSKGRHAITVGAPGNVFFRNYHKGSVAQISFSYAGDGILKIRYAGDDRDTVYDLNQNHGPTYHTIRSWKMKTTPEGRTYQVPQDIMVDQYDRPAPISNSAPPVQK